MDIKELMLEILIFAFLLRHAVLTRFLSESVMKNTPLGINTKPVSNMNRRTEIKAKTPSCLVPNCRLNHITLGWTL